MVDSAPPAEFAIVPPLATAQLSEEAIAALAKLLVDLSEDGCSEGGQQ